MHLGKPDDVEAPVLARIKAFLDAGGISYREVHHEATRTSGESARARGEDIAIGGKALLIKVDSGFRLFVFSAARRIDSKRIKARFAAKKIRFATAEELHSMTGLVPGSVPPFGKPILPFELCIDPSIGRNDKIAFNAGSLTDSLILSSKEYLAAVQGEVFEFTG